MTNGKHRNFVSLTDPLPNSRKGIGQPRIMLGAPATFEGTKGLDMEDVASVNVKLLEYEADVSGHSVDWSAELTVVDVEGEEVMTTVPLDAETNFGLPDSIENAITGVIGRNYDVETADLEGFADDVTEALVSVRWTNRGLS